MSAPRMIVPGVTKLLTRRTFRRTFLLRPSKKLNQIFEFCLAYAASKSGCLVHAYCVMSTHFHVVVTDPHGKVPVFMHWLDTYVAKCMQVELGIRESFWSPDGYNDVTLVDRDAVMREMVYTYTNPVEAGLVESHEQWPGAISRPDAIGGEPRVVERPAGYFRKKGPVPETASLELVPPPIFGEDRAAWLQELKTRIAEREAEIRAEFKKSHVAFLGARKVLRKSPFSTAKSFEPLHRLNPRVATRDKWARIEALQRLKQFLLDYRSAWLAFAAGDRDVVFPFGTYAMQVRYGVACSGP